MQKMVIISPLRIIRTLYEPIVCLNDGLHKCFD